MLHRTTHLLYLHGFRSSPQSPRRKSGGAVAEQHPDVTWWCPQLPPSPREAMDVLMRGHRRLAARRSMAVVGSSLGGFYATCVAGTAGCRAVLLNPAVHPARDLAKYIGEQTVLARPAGTLFLRAAVMWTSCGRWKPGRRRLPRTTLAVIAKGDEVLDWREMTARYPGARIRLLEGGDHALSISTTISTRCRLSATLT